MSTKNHSKKKGIIHPDKTVEVTTFDSIMPDPETLREYELLCPGTTQKWMEITQSEIAHRHKMEDRITLTFKRGTMWGQIFGFVTSTMSFLAGCYALKLGYPTAAATIITGSAAAVIAAFYFRSRGPRKIEE